jgi:hypothetical protein
MIVTMFYHGGSSYATFDTHNLDDAERYSGLKAAKEAFRSRTSDRRYPCVTEDSPEDGGPSAWIFYGEPEKIRGDYPDLTLKFGPRGGVVVERV